MKQEVGKAVTYVDEKGIEHIAIITAIWESEYPHTGKPGLNLVYVSDNETETDNYGRQIKRVSSIIHKVGQPAPGNFWLE
jgi:hypothetical protein